MSDNQDSNKSIDDFFSKPKPSNNLSAAQIGLAVFIAIISAVAVNEVYEEYKMRRFLRTLVNSSKSFTSDLAHINARNQAMLEAAQTESQRRLRELNAQNEAIAIERKKQHYLNNYWKDVGNGTFINIGRSSRNGDLALALIRINNRQVSVNVNCLNSTYWSEQNNGWFSAPDSFSTEYRIIETACSPKE